MNCGNCTAENCGRECPEEIEMTDKERMAELEARVSDLESAVEWALGEGDSNFGDNIPCIGPYWWRDELRARAFPPKFEEVEVVMYGLIFDGDAVISVSFDTFDAAERRASECKSMGENVRIIELKGMDKRPIVAKVKRREELEIACCDVNTITVHRGNISMPLQYRYFAEWEE